eukprot:10112745-Karenia_brevis.AAC.1
MISTTPMAAAGSGASTTTSTVHMGWSHLPMMWTRHLMVSLPLRLLGKVTLASMIASLMHGVLP